MEKFYKNTSFENLTCEWEGIIYTEEWRSISGYEGRYIVSNFGRIKSLKREGRKGCIMNAIDRFVSVQTDKYGYLRVSLWKENKMKNCTVHRLVLLAFSTNVKNKPQINHIDCDKTNNFFLNLEHVTAKENCGHAWKNGLSKPTVHTEETKRILSEQRKGKKLSILHRSNRSLALRGNQIRKNVSMETRRKISENQIGKFISDETRQKLRIAKKYTLGCLQLDTRGNFIKEWDSLSLAAKELSISNGHISSVCSGRRKSAGGFIWKHK